MIGRRPSETPLPPSTAMKDERRATRAVFRRLSVDPENQDAPQVDSILITLGLGCGGGINEGRKKKKVEPLFFFFFFFTTSDARTNRKKNTFSRGEV